MAAPFEAGLQVFPLLRFLLAPKHLHRILGPVRRCIGISDAYVKDSSMSILPKVMDRDVASIVGDVSWKSVAVDLTTSQHCCPSSVNERFGRDSSGANGLSSKAREFIRDIVMSHGDEPTLLAGESVANRTTVTTTITDKGEMFWSTAKTELQIVTELFPAEFSAVHMANATCQPSASGLRTPIPR